ncbi:MAG: esterase [Burkholderiales bacterium]|nr:esterase [Burkholderiales bacterium]
MLIYVHGFNSSALSHKAGLLREKMAQLGLSAHFACPELSHRPVQAMAQLQALIAPHDASTVTLVGSSLGGYYATHLAENSGVRVVLVNPAVRPYELLAPYVGPQKNLYTGEEYLFTAEHVAELRALEVEQITAERYLLITATGDEVLDYRDAVARYAGCEQIIVNGGDHGFRGFADYLDSVVTFWQRGRV